MALPSIDLPAEDFADELAYFEAQAAADPNVDVAAVAAEIAPLALTVEEGHAGHRKAIRAEVRMRAIRDSADRQCNTAIQTFRRELAGVTAPEHPTLKEVFPKPVKYEISPTGAEQAQRLQELLGRIGLALAAPHLPRDPNVAKINRVLQEGQESLKVCLERLEEAIAGWQPTLNGVKDARGKLNDAKTQALAKAGGVIGKLRGILGSDEAAYSYTKPSPRKQSPETPAATVPLPA